MNKLPPNPILRAPTIRDVAREAGVSIGTVSKVLNNTGTLAAITRARVAAVVQRLQFRPNTLAQSLHSGLSGSIGLMSNDRYGRFTLPIMEGLESVLAPAGIGVFMCNATDDPAREQSHIDQMMAKQIDGLVVTARKSDHRASVDLSGLGLPVIHVLAHADDPAALTLQPDDAGGARLAVAHLAALGRRRIAHVTGPDYFEAVRLRVAGYHAGLTDAGLAARPVLHGTWSESWGRDAVAQMFESDLGPDAIFCGNDQIARGAADALREMGLTVPDDVALIGFDNWAVIAEACRPPLTSVDMNLTELGAEAGRRMLAMIGGDTGGISTRLACSLVVRASSGPAQNLGE